MILRSRVSAALAVLAGLLPIAAGVPAVAGPVLLLEADTGRVLYAEDADHQWYPASLTKIMTAYLAFEDIKAGRLKLTDSVTVSELALAQPPSKLGLPVGAEISVDAALRVLIVKSANDVAVMLAEKMAGNVEAFAERMNATAQRIGMSRTRFVNPNGLPAPEQVTTARDLATLSRAALKDFPEHHDMWTLAEVRVGNIRLRSHNRLLKSYPGADGIKTGFICDSGFNVVASANRDGRRLVAVVLGEPSGKERNERAAALLEHGFATADWKAMLGAPTLDKLPVDASAKPVASVRTTVTAWNCNGRASGRKVARRPAKGKATQAPGRQAVKAEQSERAKAGPPQGADGAAGARKPTPRAAAKKE
ncbi:MAG: D-alanyl-D-alanine carboxypeptidase family protein [Hyphomicrobiaceae bacterium]|nr:D-alanyl-D-alanine carboxypeptidase family protein [Hyphomicrobiaceae bacterium]